MKTFVTSTSMLALLLAAGTCAAQVSPSNPPATDSQDKPTHQGRAMTSDASWDAKDTNKDGYITKEELKGDPALITHFDKIDTDHDMKISPAEWKAWGHGDAEKK